MLVNPLKEAARQARKSLKLLFKAVERIPRDPWDCDCHEQDFCKPYYSPARVCGGWRTHCKICHRPLRLAATRRQAEAMLADFLTERNKRA